MTVMIADVGSTTNTAMRGMLSGDVNHDHEEEMERASCCERNGWIEAEL